jgi:hypothetical protein
MPTDRIVPLPPSPPAVDDPGAADRGGAGLPDAALTPGDPAAVLAGDAASTEQIAADPQIAGAGPLHRRAVRIWFGHLLTGDLGQSYYYKMPVTSR